MNISRRLNKVEDALLGEYPRALERIVGRHMGMLATLLEEVFGPGAVPLEYNTGSAFGIPEELWRSRGETPDASLAEEDLRTWKDYCARRGMDISDEAMGVRLSDGEAHIDAGLDRIARDLGMTAVLEAWRAAGAAQQEIETMPSKYEARVGRIEKSMDLPCRECAGRFPVVSLPHEGAKLPYPEYCPLCGRRVIQKILIGVRMEDI